VKRAIVLAISVILALTMAAPTVLARSVNGVAPGDISGPVPPEFFPGTCDFPLQLELSGKAKTIDLPDEVFALGSISPGLHVTITNLANPENQATFNITGSLFTKPPDSEGNVTTVARGRNLLIDPVAGTVIAIGRFTFAFDAEGNLVQPLEGKGQLIDVCALLE
jgi:hypothetical protein